MAGEVYEEGAIIFSQAYFTIVLDNYLFERRAKAISGVTQNKL